MKYIIILSLILTIIACKDKQIVTPTNPQDALPPYTEKGANTFGCTIDDEVFVPYKFPLDFNAIELKCNYQYVQGEFVFVFAARNYSKKQSINFNSRNVYILPNNKYKLYFFSSIDSTFSARYWDKNTDIHYYSLYPKNDGEIHIKYLDTTRQIIAGTFWYDAVDTSTGNIVKIRDGRFDMRYTR